MGADKQLLGRVTLTDPLTGKVVFSNEYELILKAGHTTRGTPADLPEPEARAWQPIETAPKDETKIIGLTSRGAVEVSWSDTTKIYHPLYGKCVHDKWWLDCFGNLADPTHWMHLPAPPAQAQPEPKEADHA